MAGVALDSRGLVGVVAAVLEEVVEEEEDLKGANSVVVGGVEVEGADMFAPSPGK